MSDDNNVANITNSARLEIHRNETSLSRIFYGFGYNKAYDIKDAKEVRDRIQKIISRLNKVVEECNEIITCIESEQERKELEQIEGALDNFEEFALNNGITVVDLYGDEINKED
jgi:hypothetical protein